MSVINELIKVEGDALCFGNYEAKEKQKLQDFEVKGDVYKIKTFKEVTKLEKNEGLLFESVPGATVHKFTMSEKEVKFFAEGYENTQITMELEPSVEYAVNVDGEALGTFKTTMSGKLIFSAELTSNPIEIIINKA